jgi:outer membrane protein OmpA-like peptidoglycan-associated protein
MRKRILGTLCSVLLVCQAGSSLAAGDPNDCEKSKDPSLFTRMTGFHIYRYEELEFGKYDFPVGPGKTETIEGHYCWLIYVANDGIKLPSGLQVVRNYTNAATAIGGKKVYEFEDGGIENAVCKVKKDNMEVWAHITGGNAGNSQYSVYIVEKELMKQDVVADASTLASSIKETGKAAVYGIYFDTGKWDIKAESGPALKEIAKMLQANAAMKLYVVGHTDNVGTFENNVKLSNSRADAVVKELAGKYAIAASRLQPFGAGPTAPVQSNRTEEGRAKNRRVELVAQ